MIGLITAGLLFGLITAASQRIPHQKKNPQKPLSLMQEQLIKIPLKQFCDLHLAKVRIREPRTFKLGQPRDLVNICKMLVTFCPERVHVTRRL